MSLKSESIIRLSNIMIRCGGTVVLVSIFLLFQIDGYYDLIPMALICVGSLLFIRGLANRTRELQRLGRDG